MDDQQRKQMIQRITASQSYRLAYQDSDLLAAPEMRGVRLELEFLKAELAFAAQGIRSTIVVFGSTRIVDSAAAATQLELAKARLADTPDDPRRQRTVARAERLAAKSRYYDMARKFARLVSEHCQADEAGQRDYVVVTGGGPGIMEAANRGAYDARCKSVGLNIHLPMEQAPNPFIAPELCFQFRYFAIRKFHFLLRAKALVVFPGGFGTLDELFDALTLRQTGRMQNIPIILFGRDYWQRVLDCQYLADEGTIDDADFDLFRYAETAEEAWAMIEQFHRRWGEEEQRVDY